LRALALCTLVASPSASAEVLPWLYEADVEVASQSDAERRRAAGVALAEVLSRLTGMREIPLSPRIDAALDRPERFYVRYGFTNRRLEQEDPEAQPRVETRFEVLFEPDAMLVLLRRAGLPIWSADRPTVLAWIVVVDGSRRTIVGATAEGAFGEIASAMWAEARRRGLKVSLPLMDLEDRRVSSTDLQGRFWWNLARASNRYAPDLVLAGRIVADADRGWASDWELRPPSASAAPFAEFEHAATSAAGAAGEAVHRLADALAHRFAVRGGDLDAIRLTVRGAQTVRGYAAVLDYLQSREYVDRVEVNGVEPGALILRLHSRSSRDQLLELLLMGGSLLVSDPLPGPRLAMPTMELTWTGPR